jgi:hypothetical protein
MYGEDQKEIFVCDCLDYRHQFVVWTDGSMLVDDDVVTCIAVRLNHHASLIRRITEALKYIFKSDDAEYEEVMLNAGEIDRLCMSLKPDQKLFYNKVMDRIVMKGFTYENMEKSNEEIPCR